MYGAADERVDSTTGLQMTSSMMSRVVQSAVLLILCAAVLLDPLTWHKDASDVVMKAPLTQTLVAFASVALLLSALVFLWRGRSSATAAAIFIEVVVLSLWNAFLVHSIGVNRYVRGFGAEEFLSVFLVLIAVRVSMLYFTLKYGPRLASENTGGRRSPERSQSRV